MDLSLVFENLEISGFMSFPPDKLQKLDLNTKRLTAILGENLDKGDGERNGVGKSALVDALLYVYFGKSPRMSNQSFVNYIEAGSLFVAGAARRDDIVFRVERGENPSLLRLFEKPVTETREFRHKEAGKLIFETTKSTKPETTKRIVELLGFDIKITDVLLVNSSSERSCFFLKTEEEQRSIVERIFGFTVFTEKAERLREIRKEENRNLVTKESALIATKQANDRVMARIAALEEKSNAWAADRDKLARFLTQQINTYKGINFASEIDLLSQVDKLNEQIAHLEREKKTHHQALVSLDQKSKTWRDQHLTQTTALSQTIEAMKQIDAAAEVEQIKLRLKIEQDVHVLTADLQAAKRERDPYSSSIESVAVQKTKIKHQANALEQQIIQLNESKCPTCGQDWADTREHIVKSIELLDQHNSEIEDADTKINDLKKQIKQIDVKMGKLKMLVEGLHEKFNAIPETTFQTVEEATRASTSLEEQKNKLQALMETENPHSESLIETADTIIEVEAKIETLGMAIKALPGTKLANLAQAQEAERQFTTLTQQWTELQESENPYRETIDELRTQALQPVDETAIAALRRRIEHMTLLISLLADRDSPIRKAILNDWLPELNNRVNTYLDRQEIDHRIHFDPNMTATFSINDKTLTFANLSKGQRLRVWLATNRAFREIFELINYPINLLFVDELLDNGLSARGTDVAYQLLEEIVCQGKSVFLMTHRSELVDMADNVITVTLENGLSTILA